MIGKIITILIILFFLFLLFFGAFLLLKFDCERLGINILKETRYKIFGGRCLLYIDNEWIPEDNWRKTN